MRDCRSAVTLAHAHSIHSGPAPRSTPRSGPGDSSPDSIEGAENLPYSIKVILESALRHLDESLSQPVM